MARKSTIRPKVTDEPTGREALFGKRKPVETKGQRVISYIVANLVWLVLVVVIGGSAIVCLTYRAIIAFSSGVR